jgi:hypothetical protein
VKRGLVVLDPAEVPADDWRHRVDTLRHTLTEDGIDVALVYGDVSRSDDIAYLTNLCVYWNEGVLAVPADGQPTFLTKLSPRVHPWMRQVSTVDDIRSGRSFADLVTAFLGDRQPGTLGLVDADLWPASVVDEITAALPDWRVVRLAGLVRQQRVVPSRAELALLELGALAMDTAVAEATEAGLTVPERVATVERVVRGAGFLDVLAHPFQTRDGVVSLQVTGQYRTLWLQAARLADGAGEWPSALQSALASAIGAVRAGATARDLTAAAGLSGLPGRATVSWVNQADLATGGDYTDHDQPMVAGSVVAVAVDVLFPDGGYAVVAETVLVGAAGATPLTARSSA